MKRFIWLLFWFVSLIFLPLPLTQAIEDKSKPLTFLYPGWTEDVALTELAKVVLTHHGYQVKTTMVDPGPLYATLAKGGADIYLDVWLPHTSQYYWERYGDKIDILGVVYDQASTGLVVPQYVDINSIAELNDHIKEFSGKIYGIGSGSGVHKDTLRAIEEYHLDYKQITSSEAAMMAELKRRIKAKKPVIITGWKPHYKWDIYELKMLEDPKSIFPVEKMYSVSRQGFKEEYPTLTHFFERFTFDTAQLSELIELVREADEMEKNPTKGAEIYYEKYKNEIESWFP